MDSIDYSNKYKYATFLDKPDDSSVESLKDESSDDIPDLEDKNGVKDIE